MKTTNLKRFALILSLSTAVSTAIAPRPAHAIVGVVTGGATLPAGGVLLGIGMGMGMIFSGPMIAILAGGGRCDADAKCYALTTSAIGLPALMILTGIILLDEESNQAQFRTMDTALAQKIQATEVERQAFNAELEEINLIAESALLDVQAKMPAAQIAERYEGMTSFAAKSAISKLLKSTLGKAQSK